MYTIFNPAPAKIIPEKYYPFIDLLVVNQTEAEYQTGIFPQEEESCKQAIESMQRMGAKQVIITLGSRGSIFNAGESLHSVPAERVEVVDTTAAGDTFIGVTSSQIKGCAAPAATGTSLPKNASRRSALFVTLSSDTFPATVVISFT